MPKKPTTPSVPEDLTPVDTPPLPLAQEDLLRLIYDDPATYPAQPAPDLTRPAFGQAVQHSPLSMTEREAHSYEWTRTNYHRFVEHIENIESARTQGLESALSSQDLRDYVLKQLIGMSGHPDPKVSAKALDMLARSKYVGLYEEKRTKASDEMSAAEVEEAIRRLLNKPS